MTTRKTLLRHHTPGATPLSPRNVLFIENSIGLSGSTISLCNLLSHLDQKVYRPFVVFSRVAQRHYALHYLDHRINTTVITPRNSFKASPLLKAFLSRLKPNHPRFTRFLFSILALLDLFFVIGPYAFRLYRFAQKHHIHLIHHNNGFDVAAVLLARLLRIPLIAYQRGDEWNSRTVRHLSRFVHFYIANSEATRRNLLAIGVNGDRIRVVHPPVDFSRFDYRLDATPLRSLFGLSTSAPCFGIPGSLVDWKGHRCFLKAAAIVMNKIPAARAFIIGDVPDGDTAYKQELLELGRELGINDRVVFTGFRVDIQRFIQLLDVVVHASVSPEPFGRVIVEAMAMKKPVIATRAGGPIEIIQDRHTGFLTPPEDYEALAERIIEVLSDRDLAQKISEHAYEQAKARFSLPSHVRMVEEIYSKAMTLDAMGR